MTDSAATPRAQGDAQAEVINSGSYGRLPSWQQAQARAIADVLLSSVGAYRGSPTDALTDAVSILRSTQFAPPEGDNHHNAALCPYCSGGPS